MIGIVAVANNKTRTSYGALSAKHKRNDSLGSPSTWENAHPFLYIKQLSGLKS